MNKLSLGHGQYTVPMNLFASLEVDRSSPHCIPRVCSLALGKLIVINELDRDVQSVFIAVKMQGSKRVLRSNEINLPSNGLLNAELDLTFSLQYPHFIKREGNILQVMLQRKKRYKNRAMLGYKTLAIGNHDMAQIIQKPIIEESFLELISTNKDRRSSVTVVAQLVILTLTSTPTDDGEGGGERAVKRTEADRSPDVDNYSDEDEETLSSDQEIGSDVNPHEELYLDEEGTHKRKERRKVRMSSSSRQQNFIKAKLVAILRRFKQVADEGLEPDMVQDADDNVPGQVDLDFLYDEIEDLNLSDSCPEVEDNISIVSTPKPKLRPFFDRTSHSSSQTEVCSLRDQPSSEHVPFYYDSHSPDTTGNTLEKQNMFRDTFASLQNSDSTPAIDQSDTSEHEDDGEESLPSTQAESSNEIAMAGGAQSGSDPGSPRLRKHPSSMSSNNRRRKRSWPRSRSPSFRRGQQLEGRSMELQSSNEDLDTAIPDTTSLAVIHGTFSVTEDEDSEVGCSLPNSLLLINRSEKGGRALADAFQTNIATCNTIDIVVLATNSTDQLRLVFNELIGKLQKFINSNSQQPIRVKVGVAGSEPYINLVLQQFVELLSSRSPDWHTHFLFLPVPLGKQRLGQYISSLDTHYAKLFNDQTWRECFENSSKNQTSKALTPTSSMYPLDHQSGSSVFEKQQNLERTIVRRVLEYVEEASATLPLAVAEAMLTFGEKSDNEDSSQKFIPFISVAEVGENETVIQPDSDKEDLTLVGAVGMNAGVSNISNANTPTGALSLPTSPSLVSTNTAQHSGFPGLSEFKMGLQVDYWKDKDTSKYSLKTTFKSFHVLRLPAMGEHTSSPGLALDVVIIGKKNIMRLPGKKGKEKEAESKSQVIGSVNRLICTSKHQHNLLKVKIDGIEWKEVKFFQLSSHWSSHVKIFPVGLFSAR